MIRDEALREMQNTIMHRKDSHESHLARCWCRATLAVLRREGMMCDVTIEEHSTLPIEPV